MQQPIHKRLQIGFVLATAMLVVLGCSKPRPRYFTDFMEDRFAREGTLARCNENREATEYDLECANARRAAAAIALQEERERRRSLEVESEAKIEELRVQLERERQRALEAHAAKEAAEKAAYEALWQSRNPDDLTAPDGAEMPTDEAQVPVGVGIAVLDDAAIERH